MTKYGFIVTSKNWQISKTISLYFTDTVTAQEYCKYMDKLFSQYEHKFLGEISK